MALLYQPTKHAKWLDPKEGLTEQEHKDSCDINKMIRSVATGQQVRGDASRQGLFWPDGAVDDTNATLISHLVAKQDLETEIEKISQSHEFTQDELKLIDQISPSLRKKYKLKVKKNDDKTTIKTDQSPTPTPKESSTP